MTHLRRRHESLVLLCVSPEPVGGGRSTIARSSLADILLIDDLEQAGGQQPSRVLDFRVGTPSGQLAGPAAGPASRPAPRAELELEWPTWKMRSHSCGSSTASWGLTLKAET